jgi:hypothetical protein
LAPPRDRHPSAAGDVPQVPDAPDAQTEQADRAAGRYELRVDVTPADEAEWRRLRLALRLSRADLEWLKAHAPGVVRRGARSDLRPLLERLQAQGFSASIETRAGERDRS